MTHIASRFAVDPVVGMAVDRVECMAAGMAEAQDMAGTVDMDMGKEAVGIAVDIQAVDMDQFGCIEEHSVVVVVRRWLECKFLIQSFVELPEQRTQHSQFERKSHTLSSSKMFL